MATSEVLVALTAHNRSNRSRSFRLEHQPILDWRAHIRDMLFPNGPGGLFLPRDAAQRGCARWTDVSPFSHVSFNPCP